MMDRTSSRMVEPFVRAGYDTDAAAILLCEADGTADEVEEEIARMKSVLQAAGASAVQVSTSEAERLKFWSGRKNAFPAAGRISPDYYCMDGTIPRKHLARVLTGIAEMEARYGLRCANEAFGAEILSLCVAVGGTITGEHGVGIEKIDSMCVQFSDAELAAFFAVKHAFDPLSLLNPNKAIPTLNRCAEFGKLHVRGGRLPHAGLPRF
jgi:glycolate oxidase